MVGLKVASPNMERTAWAYLKDTNAADMTIMGDYGLDQTDQEELQTLSGANVEADKVDIKAKNVVIESKQDKSEIKIVHMVEDSV